MLHKLELGNEKVVAFRWEGEFDEKAFKQSMVQFLPELKIRNRMNIYMEVSDIESVEAKAIWEDMKFSFNNIKELRNKIDKVALVTDKGWIKTLAETSYTFIPGIELKSFSFEESDAALLWVNE